MMQRICSLWELNSEPIDSNLLPVSVSLSNDRKQSALQIKKSTLMNQINREQVRGWLLFGFQTNKLICYKKTSGFFQLAPDIARDLDNTWGATDTTLGTKGSIHKEEIENRLLWSQEGSIIFSKLKEVGNRTNKIKNCQFDRQIKDSDRKGHLNLKCHEWQKQIETAIRLCSGMATLKLDPTNRSQAFYPPSAYRKSGSTCKASHAIADH